MTVSLFMLLVAYAAAQDELYNSMQYITEVNAQQTTWTAGLNKRFEGKPISFIRNQCGVIMDEEKRQLKNMDKQTNQDLEMAIPATFDARTAWPECSDVINNIRDQSACGSCWAVAAAGVMSDRICIATKGKDKRSISGADLMECCWECGFGCQGGYPSMAWKWFQKPGLCTGGNHTSQSGCKPYPFPNCEHHTNQTTYKPCGSLYKTPKCVHQCQDGYTTAYNDDKFQASSSYRVSSTVESIQKELMTYGSIEASFIVYADFPSYTNGSYLRAMKARSNGKINFLGVYQHTSGKYLGGHAVRMIGWGTENGTDYWLIANSWNSDWGDKGYFKILRGNNECEIEGGLVAGVV